MRFHVTALLFLVSLNRMLGPAAVAAGEAGLLNPGREREPALAGKALFSGTTRFTNSGPACAACHSIAGLTFFNGGSVGPDLTGTAAKLGSLGLDMAMRTLYFPTMVAIYRVHPLLPQEQQDLKAFFIEAQSATPPRNRTPVVAGLAVLGCLFWLAITWWAGQTRPEPARRSLVRQRRSAEERPS
jgi:ubiquinol-cytochrome c reductase cytochrome c subunit